MPTLGTERLALLEVERATETARHRAIAWMVGKANGSVASPHSDLTAKALLAWFGVSGTVSQRAAPMLRAIDVPARATVGAHLGTPRYLVAIKRERIIDLRERWR